MADLESMYAVATANRLLAAEMFAGLTEEQWRTPSLCGGWTVREVAAHLVPPEHGVSLVFLAGQVIRYRGDLDRMADETARREARRPTEEIVRLLRERAGARLKPPVTGAAGPMSDTAIHLRDAARPLGLDVGPPPSSWEPVLDFLVSKPAARGFVPAQRLAGLRLAATDGPWSWGSGAEVTG
ncbi:maleylpyruvate isomerase family mycothiol-dependent enzyme, partial [Kineosporia sp. R_H_3]|uniref:maleylpyruvate isomerase family mycothiol-dependent enzyme n=1 Tax=Kineosporia sp. R_H_3 TaxID=1961848 RepID=UPI000B4AE18A